MSFIGKPGEKSAAGAAQVCGLYNETVIATPCNQVSTAQLLWVESAGNYVRLHTAARSLLHRVPLGRLEQHLDPADFLRVHRSAIMRRSQSARLAVAGDGSYLLGLRCGGGRGQRAARAGGQGRAVMKTARP